MATASRTLGAFTAPASLPVGEFDAINERVAQRSSGNKAVWHAFASAWSGLAYRLRAALEHSAAFLGSVSASSAPPAEQRYRQDHDLFAFVVCAVSAVECFHFAAYCIGSMANAAIFPFSQPSHLKFYPRDVLDRFVQAFPGDSITAAMQSCLASPEYATLTDLRNVLAHRGTPPRQHFLSTSGPDTPSAIPANLGDLASNWRYDIELNAHCLDPYRAWLENSLRKMVIETAIFTAARL